MWDGVWASDAAFAYIGLTIGHSTGTLQLSGFPAVLGFVCPAAHEAVQFAPQSGFFLGAFLCWLSIFPACGCPSGFMRRLMWLTLRLLLCIAIALPAPTIAQTLPVTTKSEEARALFEIARIDAFYWHSAQAIDALDAAIALDSSFVLAYLHRAGTTAPGEVREAYMSGAEAHTGAVTTGEQRLVEAFRAFLLEDEYERAVIILEGLARRYPDDPYLPGYIGMRYLSHLHDYAEAARHFGRALELDRQFLPAYHLLGRAALMRVDYDAAEGYFLEGLRRAPDRMQLHRGAGELHLARARYNDAATAFERAIELLPPKDPARTDLSRAAIEAKTAAWAEAMKLGTTATLASDLFTVSAIQIDTGAAHHGREAIVRQARAVPSLSDAVLDNEEVVVLGDLAYGTGLYALRTSEGAEARGAYLSVWRRERDGRWRIDRIMFN